VGHQIKAAGTFLGGWVLKAVGKSKHHSYVSAK
jgi:hypothetical protein